MDTDAAEEVVRLRVRVKELEEQLAVLEDRLAARALIERAKGLLMAVRGWDEARVYRALQRTSMHLREPLTKLCQRLLDNDGKISLPPTDGGLDSPDRKGEGSDHHAKQRPEREQRDGPGHRPPPAGRRR